MCRIPSNLGKFFPAIIFLCLITLVMKIYMVDHMSKNVDHMSKAADYMTEHGNYYGNETMATLGTQKQPQDHTRPSPQIEQKRARVLLIQHSPNSMTTKTIAEILDANRFEYDKIMSGDTDKLLNMTEDKKGKYGAIVFEDYKTYLKMEPDDRKLLDRYCKAQKVGIIAVVTANYVLHHAPFKLNAWKKVKDLSVAANASMLHITRGGRILPGDVDEEGMDWVSFETETAYYESVMSAICNETTQCDVVIQDSGSTDGIPKVLFGGNVHHWINRMLFLDALSWVSGGRIAFSLTRYILVDIDDVFVGKNRFHPEDVNALVKSQGRLREMVPGFRYNLGFSGGQFHKSGISGG